MPGVDTADETPASAGEDGAVDDPGWPCCSNMSMMVRCWLKVCCIVSGLPDSLGLSCGILVPGVKTPVAVIVPVSPSPDEVKSDFGPLKVTDVLRLLAVPLFSFDGTIEKEVTPVIGGLLEFKSPVGVGAFEWLESLSVSTA